MKQFAKVASIYITVVSKVFLIRYKIPKLQEFLEKFGKPIGEGRLWRIVWYSGSV